jgi:hypothetical protein
MSSLKIQHLSFNSGLLLGFHIEVQRAFVLLELFEVVNVADVDDAVFH